MLHRELKTHYRESKRENVSVCKPIDAKQGLSFARSQRTHSDHHQSGNNRGKQQIEYPPSFWNEEMRNDQETQATEHRAENCIAGNCNGRIYFTPKRLADGMKPQFHKNLDNDLQQELAQDLENELEHR